MVRNAEAKLGLDIEVQLSFGEDIESNADGKQSEDPLQSGERGRWFVGIRTQGCRWQGLELGFGSVGQCGRYRIVPKT